MEQTEIYIESTIDHSMQPSLFYKAAEEKRPLLVGLHTWSHNRFNQVKVMVPYAEKYGFNLLLPEFRGKNRVDNPNCTQACASLLAKQDIKDAVDYILAHENVDRDNVFLLGASGGGHMALMMAGFCPETFKAIGAYVPITNLEKWAAQKESYHDHVLACCSNDTEEMKKRSPITYADVIAKSNLKIFHGKYDPVVPVSHSLELYDYLMQNHPTSRVFLDIFDGGHEMDMETAMYWFMSQYDKAQKAAVTG